MDNIIICLVLILSNLCLWGLYITEHLWSVNADTELDMINEELNYLRKHDDELTKRVHKSELDKKETAEMYSSLRERLNVHILEHSLCKNK